MKEETKAEYIRLAEHFISERLKHVTPKLIKDALQGCAGEYRPAYWRRLRCALAVQQEEAGYKTNADLIRKVVNPITQDKTDLSKIKPKQRRIKSISDADEKKLTDHLIASNGLGDKQLLAAIAVISITGVRPAELQGMQIIGDEVVVTGAKQSHGGKRGADRRLCFGPMYVRGLRRYLAQLKGVDIGPLQDRLRALGKELWPQRQALPTLYSWRHQMGSNLKASGMDRRQVAYLMGHQATASVDVYGNKRSARRAVMPTVPEGAELAVRETHNLKTGAGYRPAKSPKSHKSAKAAKPSSASLG